MDVIFEPQRGRPFTIEIGYFDTVLEIKEKVQKYQGIPIAKQTLLFHGKVLQDDLSVERCEILQNSRVHLLVSVPPADADSKPPVKAEDQAATPPPPVPTSKRIQLQVRIPSLEKHVPVEMDARDTVLHLKEKIHEMEPPLPVHKLVLRSSRGDLHDHRSLVECELDDNCEVSVNVRPSPTGSGSVGSAGGPKRMKVMVATKCGTKKIGVEVNPLDNVGELRNELQKLHQRLHFSLPQEGYFFIFKQNVMDDDRSFRWHHVGQGDTIEIFNGSVTGGS